MKAIRQNILFFLVPLLAPLTASAETSRQAEPTNATSETTGSDTSWRASQVIGVDEAVIMIARIHADTDKITDELEVNSK